MNFARTVGDHLVVMADGAIVEQGVPEDVMSHPTQERTRQFLSAMNR